MTADPDDITAWNLHGYLLRRNGQDEAACRVWRTGVARFTARTGDAAQLNPRMQVWLANMEACVGEDETARARVLRIATNEPHNGYLKYRVVHVLAELGDADGAVRMLREAIRAGFLSVELLRCEEQLGLSALVDVPDYQQARQELEREVARLRKQYVSMT